MGPLDQTWVDELSLIGSATYYRGSVLSSPLARKEITHGQNEDIVRQLVDRVGDGTANDVQGAGVLDKDGTVAPTSRGGGGLRLGEV